MKNTSCFICPIQSSLRDIEIIRGVHKKKVVCILDEAHLLEKETLEEFRFLLNYRFDSMSPMALILVGQTELWDEKLRLQRYAAIRQRIDMNCVLSHLDRAEVEKYIQSHLQYAGGSTEIFTAKALDVVAKESSGIPRMINRICEKSLMYAFQQQRKLIDDYMVVRRALCTLFSSSASSLTTIWSPLLSKTKSLNDPLGGSHSAVSLPICRLPFCHNLGLFCVISIELFCVSLSEQRHFVKTN